MPVYAQSRNPAWPKLFLVVPLVVGLLASSEAAWATDGISVRGGYLAGTGGSGLPSGPEVGLALHLFSTDTLGLLVRVSQASESDEAIDLGTCEDTFCMTRSQSQGVSTLGLGVRARPLSGKYWDRLQFEFVGNLHHGRWFIAAYEGVEKSRWFYGQEASVLTAIPTHDRIEMEGALGTGSRSAPTWIRAAWFAGLGTSACSWA